MYEKKKKNKHPYLSQCFNKKIICFIRNEEQILRQHFLLRKLSIVYVGNEECVCVNVSAFSPFLPSFFNYYNDIDGGGGGPGARGRPVLKKGSVAAAAGAAGGRRTVQKTSAYLSVHLYKKKAAPTQLPKIALFYSFFCCCWEKISVTERKLKIPDSLLPSSVAMAAPLSGIFSLLLLVVPGRKEKQARTK